MADPRIKAYAQLLVERCVKAKPGDQIVLDASPDALPLIEEIARRVNRAGARLIPFIASAAMRRSGVEDVPEDQIEVLTPLFKHVMDNADASILIPSSENTRALASVDPKRQALYNKSRSILLKRYMRMEARWTIGIFPTQGMAQEANMSLEEYEDFIYGACLIDWDSATELMNRVKDRFDAGKEVRILGRETDLRFSIKGRPGVVDDGVVNMPGGEVFYAPHEETVEGYITYDYPCFLAGQEADNVRLVFKGGKVVEATASRGQDFLLQALDTDEGSRYIGEFGIGCNYNIDRIIKHMLFDEKIGGTIHLALGNAYTVAHGTNKSNLHWDMLKDMRQGGQLWLDGTLVQENGQFIDV